MTKRLFTLVFMSIIMLACETIEMKLPDGFAHYSREKDHYKIISSDGVTIKAYRVEMDEQKENIDVTLWVKETGIVLKSKGYVKIKDEEISGHGGLKGIYSEYTFLYNGETHIYATTLFAKGDKLYIVESGGQKKYYDKRKEAIMKAIRSLTVH